MAGVVYNILHNVPWTTVGKDGQTEFFSSGNRQQLGAEGLIMSFTISMVGIIMIIYHHIPKFFDNKSTARIVYLILFCLVAALVKFVEGIYKKKGYYNPEFYPPANYIKGPLMNDQGNSF
jgi:oligosaccharyltransferase complex subunit gamma